MSDGEIRIHEVPLAALLRRGRTAFGLAMRRALEEAGYDDLPRDGLYLIGAIARETVPLSQVIDELRVSKQVAGQLVDTLVLRGYLNREVDSDDRRRLTITLTRRGRGAAAVQRKAAEKIEAELLRKLGPDHLARTRETLALLGQMGFEAKDEKR
jgi:DNA-binding MarR family transcriptional regulator